MMGKKSVRNKDKDVLIVGDLCDIDLAFVEYLERSGLNCLVARPSVKKDVNLRSAFPNVYDKVAFFESPIEFYRLCLSCCAIVNFTLGLFSSLRYLYFLRFFHFPPIINIATGSDITELIDEKNILGWLYRLHLRTSSLNWIPPCPHALKNIIKHKITQVVLMNYPFYLNESELSERKHLEEKQLSRGAIKFFHPSHLDWKINDPGKHRNSSKGNDRFLRAFIKALREGLNAVCTILDRGPDRDIAKKIIKESGFSDHFIWKPHLSRDELFYEYRNADVVVDQFDVGCPGNIAIEAMYCGKSVMTYVNDECMQLAYPEFPPVLNCYTEDEIFKQIMRCRDKNFLESSGKKSRDFVLKYHHWSVSLKKFIFYYTLITGHKVVDYGWESDPYLKS